MDRYDGPALLEFPESVPVAADAADAPARFPVRYVIRHGGVRHCAAPQSVGVRPADQRDVSLGDMITAGSEAPVLTRDVTAAVCHLADRPLRVGDRVLLRHTTRTVKAIVRDLAGAPELTANDLGRITLRGAEPAALDAYAVSRRTGAPAHRRTGAFILIDPADGGTLTAGVVDFA